MWCCHTVTSFVFFFFYFDYAKRFTFLFREICLLHLTSLMDWHGTENSPLRCMISLFTLDFYLGKFIVDWCNSSSSRFCQLIVVNFNFRGSGPLSLSLCTHPTLCICCREYIPFLFFLFLLYFNSWNYCVFNIRKIAWRYFTLVRPFITVATCCSWPMHMKKKRNKIRKQRE